MFFHLLFIDLIFYFYMRVRSVSIFSSLILTFAIERFRFDRITIRSRLCALTCLVFTHLVSMNSPLQTQEGGREREGEIDRPTENPFDPWTTCENENYKPNAFHARTSSAVFIHTIWFALKMLYRFIRSTCVDSIYAQSDGLMSQWHVHINIFCIMCQRKDLMAIASIDLALKCMRHRLASGRCTLHSHQKCPVKAENNSGTRKKNANENCGFDPMSRRSIFGIYRNKFVGNTYPPSTSDVKIPDWHMQHWIYDDYYSMLANGPLCNPTKIECSSVELIITIPVHEPHKASPSDSMIFLFRLSIANDRNASLCVPSSSVVRIHTWK